MKLTSLKNTAPEVEENEDVDEAPVSVADRIKAAQAALGAGGAVGGKPPVPTPRRPSARSTDSASMPTSPPPPPSRGGSGPPAPPPRTTPSPTPPPSASLSAPAPPRRTPSGNAAEVAPPQPNRPGGPGGLVSSRGIGSIDTSSAGSAVSTVFSFKGMGKNEKKGPDMYIPTQPSAFSRAKTKDTYAPPPRRGASETNTVSKKHEPEPEPEAEQEEEEGEYAQGEWVEALYEFDSSVSDNSQNDDDALLTLLIQDSTDLSFKAKDQLFVTERTSKDWWMAEKDGRSGLIPAAYVKPL